MWGFDFSAQDNADRLTRIRMWAELAMRGDESIIGRMEHALQQTGYWRAYHTQITANANSIERATLVLSILNAPAP